MKHAALLAILFTTGCAHRPMVRTLHFYQAPLAVSAPAQKPKARSRHVPAPAVRRVSP